ncbi:MAG: excinuclease ABC subunit UvrC [bacterium]
MDPVEEKIRRVPGQPGVYVMKSAQGAVLYVGKAKNLRARLRSYVGGGARDLPKVRFLMPKVKDLECIVTGTEKEALLLENTLIKQHRPRYNINLKDDKTYLHILLDRSRPFPRFEAVRRPEPGPERDIFGPYASAAAVRQTLRQLYRLYPLRTCKDGELGRRRRPCLWYQMGRCAGVCVGKISREKYMEMVDQAVLVLQGKNEELIRLLQQKMQEAAEALRYEEAAALRDRIQAVRATLEQQRVVDADPADRDVIGAFEKDRVAEIAVLKIRNGSLVERKGFFFADIVTPLDELLSSFLVQYYWRPGEGPPEEILLPVELEDQAAIEEALRDLRGAACRLLTPRRGDKAELVKLAADNATALWEEQTREDTNRYVAIDEVRRKLALERPPRRIECFDISNLHGEMAVGSRVAFRDGSPYRDGYRRYKIRVPRGADDYGMMYEVLLRRFQRGKEEGDFPDLLLVDGGKGHLQVAVRVLRDLGIEDVPAASIAKVRGRRRGVLDLPPSDGGGGADRIFVPGKVNPLRFPARSKGFHLLQRIRDEAHRFAVSYHRKLRSRALQESELDAIPGVGRARKRALLESLGDTGRIRGASVEELRRVPGMTARAAEAVFGYFHPAAPAGEVKAADPSENNPAS